MKRKKSCAASEGAQIEALFLDYDGTISPIDVRKCESFTPSKTAKILRKISGRIPVAIITFKSLQYVVPKTPFAHAWSALGGLETRIGNVVSKAQCLERMFSHLVGAFQYSKNLLGNDLTIEEKLDSEGKVAGFSVDWRRCKDHHNAMIIASKMLSYYENLPLTVIRYEKQPFFDVFPCPISKGQALENLKRQLGLCKGILYMGDSKVDNSAFRLADFSVGVVHAETSEDLSCDYLLKFGDVPTFLNYLLENSMRFNPEFPLIVHKK